MGITAARTSNSFAFTFGLGQLGEGRARVDVHDDGHAAHFSVSGVAYATMAREGEEVVVSVHVAEGERAWALEQGYQQDPKRKGWLFIKLDRSARAWADANVSGVSARAVHALVGIAI